VGAQRPTSHKLWRCVLQRLLSVSVRFTLAAAVICVSLGRLHYIQEDAPDAIEYAREGIITRVSCFRTAVWASSRHVDSITHRTYIGEARSSLVLDSPARVMEPPRGLPASTKN